MTPTNFLKDYGLLCLVLAWFAWRAFNRFRISRQLPSLLARGAVIVDVRSEVEYASGHELNTLNIPLPELGQRLQELPRGVPVVVCCASGTRSGFARRQLLGKGFAEVYNMGSWTGLRGRLGKA